MRRTHASRQGVRVAERSPHSGRYLTHDDRNARRGCRAVAARLGFEHWLGSGVGIVDECYTGRADGEPCFQEGKVNHLARWREQNPDAAQAADTWFYSDSHNDCHCSRTWVIPWRLIPTPDSAHMPSRRVAGDLSSRLIAGFLEWKTQRQLSACFINQRFSHDR